MENINEKKVGVAGFEPYKSISFGKNWLTSLPFLITLRIFGSKT